MSEKVLDWEPKPLHSLRSTFNNGSCSTLKKKIRKQSPKYQEEALGAFWLEQRYQLVLAARFAEGVCVASIYYCASVSSFGE